jgi:hypothetical protein
VLHVVLLKPKTGATAAQFAALWSALEGLKDRIPGIASVACGPNASPEGLEQGYTQGFVMRFDDAQARDAYLPHPEHQAVIPLVLAVAESVLVFDLAG